MKKLIIVFILTVLATILASPLYTTNYMWSAAKTNKQARIDIKNNGEANSNLFFDILPEDFEKSTPAWFKSNTGQGTVLSFPIPPTPQEQTINFVVKGDGKLTIDLKGPHEKNNAVYYPRWVEYTKLNVNGKNVLAETQTVWHDTSFVYEMNVADGQKISIEITAQRHKFHLNDIFKLYGFNWKICFSIFVLSFLIFYKLIQHILRVVSGGVSCIDIVFLCAFFSVLFIPMLHISDAEKSDVENRKLAKYIPLISNKGINNEYGKNFESWFNDRFFGRNYLIRMQGSIFSILGKYSNERAVKAKDDMIFNKQIIEDLLKPLSEDESQKIVKNIKKLKQFSDKNNIILYILIPPAKEDVFFQNLKLYQNSYPEINAIHIQKIVKESYEINIIYPRDIYKQSYNELTHSKTDHHWTEFGAYLGYKKLVEEMQKKFPDLKALELSEFNVFFKNKPRFGSFENLFDRPFYNGSDCERLNLDEERCPLYPHAYYDHKNKAALKVSYGPIKMSRTTHFNNAFKKKVTLLGNSYGGFLMSFLPYTFQDVQMLRVNNEEKGIQNDYDMKRFEKYIVDFKTDILIFYVASSYIRDFIKLYEE